MGVTSTQGFKFKLVADGQQLDLFKDEEIKLSDNVTGLFDLGVLPADFTRQITLPGTKVNNNFFEFVYDISVESPYTFSTNQKVSCYLDFDGIYLSAGYLQLNKVNVYQNKFVDSYEITIFGGLASFGRDLKRYFLTDLTSSLSAYNHTASYDNIYSSWNAGLFSGSIIYPLAEYGQKITYQNGNTQFGIQSVSGSLCVQDFKPAIKMKTVFDACFSTFGYTYTSSFMDQAWINNIYMVCNNKLRYPVFDSGSNGSQSLDLETYGQFRISALSGSAGGGVILNINSNQALDWYNVEANPGNNLNVENLNYTIGINSAVRGNLNLNFEVSSSSAGNGMANFILNAYNTGTATYYSTPLVNYNNYLNEVQRYNSTQTRTQVFELLTEFTTPLLPSGSYRFGLQYTTGSQAGTNFKVTLNPGTNCKSYLELTKVNQGGEGLIMDIPSNMPFGTSGIRLVDFISSVQKKYNLVIYPNKTKLNEFIIEPFNTWYTQGEIKDFNRYINLNDKITVTPANNLAVQQLNFGDTLDNDYVSLQFARGANREYGKSYYVDQENYFSQGTFEVKTGFASSPLLYLSGTGISGSATAGTPIAYQLVGEYRLGRSSEDKACSAPAFRLYSTSGYVDPGATLYWDAYGNAGPVLGYYYIVDSIDNCLVYDVNSDNGVIGSSTGFNCPYCV